MAPKRADLKLKQTQWLWETPKGIAAMAVVIGALAGILGYQIGRTPQQPMFPPGTVIAIPLAPK